MKVILLQNIKGIGRIGDIKNVADGYGRNYLLAKGLAKLATDGTIKETETLKKKGRLEEKLALEKARQVAEDLKNIVLNFTKKASETGKLFASLTKEEIAAQLSKIIGAKVKPDSIDLKEHGEHIKQEGEHMIEVNLAPNIKVELKVFVKS